MYSVHGCTIGGKQTKTYMVWNTMKRRCLNPQNKVYASYGGRGICVCDRWLKSFAAFLADMGEKPEGHQIDRINNDGDYEPSNCRWVSRKTQNNNRRTNRNVTFNGRTQTVQQWGEELGIKPPTLLRRLMAGWSNERALTEPVKGSG